MPSKATLEERALLQKQGYSWRVVKFPARVTWYKPDGTTFQSIGEQANRIINLRKGYRLDPFPANEVAIHRSQIAAAEAERTAVIARNTAEQQIAASGGDAAMPQAPNLAEHHHIYNKRGQRCKLCGKVRERGFRNQRPYNEELKEA